MGIGLSRGYTRGFSSRLNKFCDIAGLKPADNGRPAELGKITGRSRTGCRNWIKEDSIPRASILEVLVDSLILRIPEVLDKELLKYWLINGGESPFSSDKVKSKTSYFGDTNPFLVQKVFSEALSVADEMNVDLHSFNEAQLDALYSPLIHLIHQYPNLDIRELITSNLILATSKLN